MRFEPIAALPDLLLVEPEVHEDERGFFFEAYHQRKAVRGGITEPFVQDNHSGSHKGVLRGLHFQHPKGQGKLVRTTRGGIFDVAVDVRVGSPTFGRWWGVELNEDNHLQLWLPAGFAHGFLVLSEWAEVEYKCTEFYSPADEHVLLWNDPRIGIRWPMPEPSVSRRDAAGRSLIVLEEGGVLPTWRGTSP